MSSAPHHVRTHLYPLSLGCHLHQHVLSTWWRKSCQDQVPTLPHLVQAKCIVISTPHTYSPLHSHPPHTNANRYYIVQGEKDPPSLLRELSLVGDELQPNLSIRSTMKADWNVMPFLSLTSFLLPLPQARRIPGGFALRLAVGVLLPGLWVCENGKAAARPMCVPEPSVYRGPFCKSDTHTHTHLTTESISISLQCTREKGKDTPRDFPCLEGPRTPRQF